METTTTAQSRRQRTMGCQIRFPLVQVGGDEKFEVKGFRPGPLRELLHQSGRGIDRCYGAIAYVMANPQAIDCLPTTGGWMIPMDGDSFVFLAPGLEAKLASLKKRFPNGNVISLPVVDDAEGNERAATLDECLVSLLTTAPEGEPLPPDPVLVLPSLNHRYAQRFLWGAWDRRCRLWLATPAPGTILPFELAVFDPIWLEQAGLPDELITPEQLQAGLFPAFTEHCSVERWEEIRSVMLRGTWVKKPSSQPKADTGKEDAKSSPNS